MSYLRARKTTVAVAAVITTSLSSLTAASSAAITAPPGAAPPKESAVVRPGSAPSFAQFEADTFRDTDGQYIVNGDEALADRAALRAYYDKITTAKKKGSSDPGLIVNLSGGRLDAWSDRTAGNLTYCVSNSFGSQKAAVVNAISRGAASWESSSSTLDFRYVPSADANCSTANNTVLFPVQPTSTNQYIARAFFPSSSDAQRNVLVNATSLLNSSSSAASIMGHELGHTLGFRHEHTRPEAGACFEDNSWYPLTPYDASSIMHYPQCNGASRALSFSTRDRQGVAALYGG